MHGTRNRLLLILASGLAWWGGLLIADARRPDVEVITLRPDQVVSYDPRPGRVAPQIALGSRCTEGASPPDPTWTCENSVWTAPAAANVGGVGPGRAAGCVTVAPANQFTCINGVWMIQSVATPSSSSSTAPGSAEPAGPPGSPLPISPTSMPCLGTPPVVGTSQSVACDNGVWVVR